MAKELDQGQIIRHLEEDMGCVLDIFNRENVYEVMLNPYKREDGTYEGHIWYEQAGKGMVRAIEQGRLDIARYSTPQIGDAVFYKYANENGQELIINYHDVPSSRQEILDVVSMVLKNSIKTDVDGNDYLEQEENFKLNVLSDNIANGIYSFREPIADYDIESYKIVDMLNKKLARILGIVVKVKVMTIKDENDLLLFNRKPKYVITKEFVTMKESKALQIMQILAAANSLHFHDKEPRLECSIPLYNHRFTGQRAPIVTFPSFAIRKHGSEVLDLEDYVTDNIMPAHVAETIRDWITRGFNILIAGGVGSGKTTLLNSIIRETARIYPDGQRRPAIIEDTPEIQCEMENAVLYRKSNEVTMDDLLVTALRMRPNFIMVGEVRSREAYTLFKAMLTGHTNCYGTIHANGAYEATFRFEQCVREHPDCSGSAIPRHQIALALNGVISIQKTTVRVQKNGSFQNIIKRKVTALRQITGYDPKYDKYEDIILYQDKEAVIEEVKPSSDSFSKYQVELSK